jgi:hypothetical protein
MKWWALVRTEMKRGKADAYRKPFRLRGSESSLTNSSSASPEKLLACTENVISLSCSQEATSGPQPQPYKYSSSHRNIRSILMFYSHNFVWSSLVSNACYIHPSPHHPPWLTTLVAYRWLNKVKIFITQLSPTLNYFSRLGPNIKFGIALSNTLQPSQLYSRIARLSLRESKCSKWRLVIDK